MMIQSFLVKDEGKTLEFMGNCLSRGALFSLFSMNCLARKSTPKALTSELLPSSFTV
ncbi:MAG: hypothetical protein Q7J68_05930 [Thermoplasmata archaeon]|nr:hypothetical protein [Thermoplasmata archaeon]